MAPAPGAAPGPLSLRGVVHRAHLGMALVAMALAGSLLLAPRKLSAWPAWAQALVVAVASVAMLPPTLIASVYGMNFQGFFPEIHWDYGYPFSLALMLFSVAVPFWFFYKKGWLR